jgi:hypothetical protein
VAGIPARVVGRCAVAEPALEMDATFPWVVEGGRASRPGGKEQEYEFTGRG